MNRYQTSATVEAQGQIRVVGLPFEPGTRVEVSITATENDVRVPDSIESDRSEQLFAALDKSRNVESIGPLNRGEVYDRDGFH